MYAFRVNILKVLLSLFIVVMPLTSSGWGFWAHKRINRMAIYALPKPLFYFFKQNLDVVEAEAVKADKRRYAVKDEAPCHYIDLDRYGNHPFDSLPQNWKSAVAKFSEDTLMEHGIVPWKVQWVYRELVNAFIEKDQERIIRKAADLGHYVADAHVPLHCTSNYNGQLTGQDGIHGLWESRLPELFGENFNSLVGQAQFIEDVGTFIWKVVGESYAAVDSVLLFEKQLSASMAADIKRSVEVKGRSTVRTYSIAFCESYHNMLGGMVGRRYNQSIYAIASLWYSAWVEAGQPDPINFDKNGGFSADTLNINGSDFKTVPIHGHTD